ncbi:MAG: hypothetical protein Q3988_00670 [Gemella sp.]|nr:hypothetical protein [Gemella sp.]
MKKIYKVVSRLKDNQGSAILISLSMLLLVVTVVFSISNIYMNKVQSIKNINTFYDRKINEALELRIKEVDQKQQNEIREAEKENNKKIQIEESRKKKEELEKEKAELIEKINSDRLTFDKEVEKNLEESLKRASSN